MKNVDELNLTPQQKKEIAEQKKEWRRFVDIYCASPEFQKELNEPKKTVRPNKLNRPTPPPPPPHQPEDVNNVFQAVVEADIQFEILRVKEAYRDLIGKFLEGSGRNVIRDGYC